jgi:hypothetical protein
LKNINIKIYETIILPVVSYGHEIQSLTLRDQHVPELGAEKDILVYKRGSNRRLENSTTRSFMICTHHQKLCG